MPSTAEILGPRGQAAIVIELDSASAVSPWDSPSARSWRGYPGVFATTFERKSSSHWETASTVLDQESCSRATPREGTCRAALRMIPFPPATMTWRVQMRRASSIRP